MDTRTKILIAGIAGASLGTEIAKCLKLSNRYRIYGCDVSTLAYGHYTDYFEEVFLANINTYVDSILDFCRKNNIKYIIPGGESPNVLLSNASNTFKASGITIVSNNSELVDLGSSKKRTFDYLASKSVLIPKTWTFNASGEIPDVEFPCIIKPSENSGGSNFVYIVKNKQELRIYSELLLSNNLIPVIQEYIDHTEGEFTVGVLSSTHGDILGSIALKRVFNSKLSIALKSDNFLISSGYTQGLIDDFPNVIETCNHISKLLKSTGPLNIQGRLKNNQFIPFEVNARFSASTYLRALAGFNEVDFYLRHLVNGENDFNTTLKYGYYLRSFEETYVSKENVVS